MELESENELKTEKKCLVEKVNFASSEAVFEVRASLLRLTREQLMFHEVSSTEESHSSGQPHSAARLWHRITNNKRNEEKASRDH